MTVSLKPSHLKRYKDVAVLVLKYAHSDLVTESGISDELDEPVLAPENAPKAEELADDLEKMGPTFVKLGQLLSTRAEFVPPAYLAALSRLQDNVAPFPF